MENLEYLEYLENEEKLKLNYKQMLYKKINDKCNKNFRKIKKMLENGNDNQYLDGFYFPAKAIQLFNSEILKYFLNGFMDLTISDILNLIDNNSNIKGCIDEIFNDYNANSSLAWGENLIEVLSNI